MPRTKLIILMAFTLILGMCASGLAEEECKTKGLDIVTDTALVIIHKANAFFQGHLVWTMEPDTGTYKKDYTVDALGRRIPRSTLGKYDSGEGRAL